MVNTVNDYLKLPYTLELVPDPDGGFAAAVKELPGCLSQGDTPEEALEMIRDAMRLWIETALDDVLPVPEPRPQESYSGKFVVRVPRSLHRRLVENAEAEGVSLNQYINVALAGVAIGEKPPAPPQPVEAGEMVTWPGLSAAIADVLRNAGYAQQAGDIDERLFADWLGGMLSNIEGAAQSQDYSEALRYLDRTLIVLSQNGRTSPVLELLVVMLDAQRRLIEGTLRLQQAFVRQVVQPGLQERIREVNSQIFEKSERDQDQLRVLSENIETYRYSEKTLGKEDLRKLLGRSKDE